MRINEESILEDVASQRIDLKRWLTDPKSLRVYLDSERFYALKAYATIHVMQTTEGRRFEVFGMPVFEVRCNERLVHVAVEP